METNLNKNLKALLKLAIQHLVISLSIDLAHYGMAKGFNSSLIV